MSRPARLLLASIATLVAPLVLTLPPATAGPGTGLAAAQPGAAPGNRPAVGQGKPRTKSADRPAIGAGNLRVEIVDVSPDVPELDDDVTLRGTVGNVSAVAARDVSVMLRLSSTPLPNRSEIAAVLVSGTSTRYGNPLAGVTQSISTELAPGESASFTLKVAVDDLGLGPSGAYVLGVEARASTGSGVVAQDLDRTLLPWWPEDHPAQPLLLTTLWPLTGRPERDASGVLLSDDLAVDMSKAGRLDNLVAASAEHPADVATLLIDPELVEAAADMSAGYEVRVGDTTTAGTRSAEAETWLRSLDSIVSRSGSQATISIYGNPDVAAARRGKVLSTILAQRPEARRTVSSVLQLDAANEVVLAPGGFLDQPTLDALAEAGVAGVVLWDRAYPTAPPTTFTPSGNVAIPAAGASLPALLADSPVSDTLAMPMQSPADLTRARQRLLAETLVTVSELPATQRLLVVSPPEAWTPSAAAAHMVLGALSDPPWVVPTPVSAALAREPSTVARSLATYTDALRADELSTSYVASVHSQFEGLGEYSRVLSDPDDMPADASRAPTRAMGGYFRTNTQVAGQLIEAIDAQVDDFLRSIKVISSGSVTVSGTSGTIPVTIENAGPLPVTVGLTLTSTPAQLFLADPLPPVRIDAGRRTSLEVTAQVASGGPIQVDITIVDAAGEPFGKPAVLVVESAAYAGAARVLVRASLAFLVIAVVVHAVRRARRTGGKGSGNRTKESHD